MRDITFKKANGYFETIIDPISGYDQLPGFEPIKEQKYPVVLLLTNGIQGVHPRQTIEEVITTTIKTKDELLTNV